MANENWSDVLDEDYRPFGPVTDGLVKAVCVQSPRLHGSVRMMAGNVETSKEHEERRRKMHAAPL